MTSYTNVGDVRVAFCKGKWHATSDRQMDMEAPFSRSSCSSLRVASSSQEACDIVRRALASSTGWIKPTTTPGNSTKTKSSIGKPKDKKTDKTTYKTIDKYNTMQGKAAQLAQKLNKCKQQTNDIRTQVTPGDTFVQWIAKQLPNHSKIVTDSDKKIYAINVMTSVVYHIFAKDPKIRKIGKHSLGIQFLRHSIGAPAIWALWQRLLSEKSEVFNQPLQLSQLSQLTTKMAEKLIGIEKANDTDELILRNTIRGLVGWFWNNKAVIGTDSERQCCRCLVSYNALLTCRIIGNEERDLCRVCAMKMEWSVSEDGWTVSLKAPLASEGATECTIGYRQAVNCFGPGLVVNKTMPEQIVAEKWQETIQFGSKNAERRDFFLKSLVAKIKDIQDIEKNADASALLRAEFTTNPDAIPQTFSNQSHAEQLKIACNAAWRLYTGSYYKAFNNNCREFFKQETDKDRATYAEKIVTFAAYLTMGMKFLPEEEKLLSFRGDGHFISEKGDKTSYATSVLSTSASFGIANGFKPVGGYMYTVCMDTMRKSLTGVTLFQSEKEVPILPGVRLELVHTSDKTITITVHNKLFYEELDAIATSKLHLC